MNKSILKIFASAFLLIIGFVCGSLYNKTNDEQKKEIVTSGSDFEMIQEVTNEFVTAWINGDAEGCANTYSENAVFMVPDQPSYHRRKAIKDRYEKMFNKRNDSTLIEMTETVKEVIVLDDWAVIRGSGFETRDSEGASGTYKWIILSKKQPNGKWESVWDIFNDVEDVK
ncbi:nuclear transport factor 2 family protein [Maribacter sp. ANRC-HE7]|uniref:Nuclear transport factor 2 family protein n=1 Tax=Maribacter aquimaris TaxID=2737171 RepID=A0ABR7V9E9_9FLAO|nr:nuclear transport factor 2 family protein [Maribacter aquimaris]MBD0779957.1 nuclear transport factor 2 family protein [Maribacter aquimaris]